MAVLTKVTSWYFQISSLKVSDAEILSYYLNCCMHSGVRKCTSRVMYFSITSWAELG